MANDLCCSLCENCCNIRDYDSVCSLIKAPQKHFDCRLHEACDNFKGWWYEDIFDFIKENDGVTKEDITKKFWRLSIYIDKTLDFLEKSGRIIYMEGRYI